jgi:DNA ligase (NAD+)
MARTVAVRIRRFVSRSAFDIGGFGPRTVAGLVKGGLVHAVADLFTLTDDDLRGLPGFGAIAAHRLTAAITSAQRIELDRFLVALGIPGVGAATARMLAERFKTLGAVRYASKGQLTTGSGIGPVVGDRIARFFSRPAHQADIDALLRHGVTVLPYRTRGVATRRSPRQAISDSRRTSTSVTARQCR